MKHPAHVRKTIAPAKVRTNEFGLVIIDKNSHEVGHKIALNYLDAKIRVRHALVTGKKLLFMPGTYDLLHSGHLVWFDQAIKKFTTRLKLKREDVFVVVPFDNDSLTRIMKIKKHISQGGKEVYLRPVVNEVKRAVSLANLPYVDLIMPIPSPLDAQDVLTNTPPFDLSTALSKLEKTEIKKGLTTKEAHQIRKVLKKYYKMISPAHLFAMQASFASKGFLSSEPESIYKKIGIDSTLWNNTAWQLMCFLYKMDSDFFANSDKAQIAYRVISEHDGYLPQVKFIMGLAGVKTLSIKEDYITSTTQIIKKNNSRDKMDALIASTDPQNYHFW